MHNTTNTERYPALPTDISDWWLLPQTKATVQLERLLLTLLHLGMLPIYFVLSIVAMSGRMNGLSGGSKKRWALGKPPIFRRYSFTPLAWT